MKRILFLFTLLAAFGCGEKSMPLERQEEIDPTDLRESAPADINQYKKE